MQLQKNRGSDLTKNKNIQRKISRPQSTFVKFWQKQRRLRQYYKAWTFVEKK